MDYNELNLGNSGDRYTVDHVIQLYHTLLNIFHGLIPLHSYENLRRELPKLIEQHCRLIGDHPRSESGLRYLLDCVFGKSIPQKNPIDFGEQHHGWTEEQLDNLHCAIHEIYRSHIPHYLYPDEICGDILKIYAPSNSHNARTISGIIKKISEIQKNDIYNCENYSYENIYMIREWSPKGNIEKKIECSLPTSMTINSRVKCNIGITKNDKHAFFIFPRVPQIDFARIFFAIFSILRNSSSVDQLHDSIKEQEASINLASLTGYPKGPNQREKMILRNCVYYQLDFFFAYIASEACGTISADNGRSSWYEITKALRLLRKKIDYECSLSDELKQKLKSRYINDKHGQDYFNEILRIANSDIDNISLHPYSFEMSKIFELYTYSILLKNNGFELVEYQKELDIPESKKHARPDFYLISDDKTIIIDAKYKFDYYRDNYYDDLDLNRMFKYLVAGTNNQDSKIRRAVFIYPTTSSLPPDFNPIKDYLKYGSSPFPFIIKEPLILPVRKK